mgnify:CR=1 FL=1
MIRFFINSNIWVAFCVLGLAASSEIILQTSNPQISQFLFFATVFTYNFQRIVSTRKGNNHARKNWLRKNISQVYLLMLFSFLMSGYFFLNFQLITQIAIFFTAILSLLYPFGIRKIPFAKIFVISFVWCVGTMFLLVIENNILISQNILWHLTARMLFVFAITIPFDIRDLKHDCGHVATIPGFFGVDKAKDIAIINLFICVIIGVFQLVQNEINESAFLALILLYSLACVIIKRSNENKSEMYFSFWVESLSIFSYLFLIILLLIF